MEFVFEDGKRQMAGLGRGWRAARAQELTALASRMPDLKNSARTQDCSQELKVDAIGSCGSSDATPDEATTCASASSTSSRKGSPRVVRWSDWCEETDSEGESCLSRYNAPPTMAQIPLCPQPSRSSRCRVSRTPSPEHIWQGSGAERSPIGIMPQTYDGTILQDALARAQAHANALSTAAGFGAVESLLSAQSFHWDKATARTSSSRSDTTPRVSFHLDDATTRTFSSTSSSTSSVKGSSPSIRWSDWCEETDDEDLSGYIAPPTMAQTQLCPQPSRSSTENARGPAYQRRSSRRNVPGATPVQAPALLEDNSWKVGMVVVPPPPVYDGQNYGGRTRADTEYAREVTISKGSLRHPHACGEACKYARKKRGCKDSAACDHCHLCEWKKGDDEAMMTRRRDPEAPVAMETTVMLRNMPNCFTLDDFCRRLRQLGFEGDYDFVFVPGCRLGERNMGFAFINLCSRDALDRFMAAFHEVPVRQCLPGSMSKKVCQVRHAEVQGRQANFEKFFEESQAAVAGREKWRPLFL